MIFHSESTFPDLWVFHQDTCPSHSAVNTVDCSKLMVSVCYVFSAVLPTQILLIVHEQYLLLHFTVTGKVASCMETGMPL